MAALTNSRTAVGSATISAALTTILITLDTRSGMNFGPEFIGSCLVVLFALPWFTVEAILWCINIYRIVRSADEIATKGQAECQGQAAQVVPVDRSKQAP